MSKILATCAAAAVTALLALPAPAGAAERTAAGVKQADSIEISAARRHYRGHHSYRRYGYRPHYRHYGYYRGYGYNPYYRPYYYRPGLSVGVGPFGLGFRF